MELINTILIIIAALLLLLPITGFIYLATGGRIFYIFYHNILEWHIPDDKKDDDGYTICRFCGKRLQQDSQGNWYEYPF